MCDICGVEEGDFIMSGEKVYCRDCAEAHAPWVFRKV